MTLLSERKAMDGWTLTSVALGGALGGMGRLFVSRWAASAWGSRFPWGTMLVNLLGALVIGLLASLLEAGSTLALMLLTGVMGGFTTVSSFSLQTLDLLREGRLMAAIANVGVTLIVGLSAVAAGWMLGSLIDGLLLGREALP
ncbi:MAG: fluoride efflux transporter CrcB [Pseudomonadota bacterium]|uniref:fluoride efflux transporter CrcB n=1 Tax=Halomonas sp. DP5Y7-2 TaxID=2859076 RepID=UPI0021BD5EF8|nr:fluoride efflux transporter CrcB [Halomonas sp. DP5Y7-2]MEE3214914.1 fluoride efflux transporter CrcB [Pseudomonadota bacterium]